ncbi:MAG TPA: TIGR04063 family PEP-CTERM/XrtA system glycosyltransferase [Steroidobacteraceae bacterium]|nr:TIGR04063 family PEP-CTERM/XrtA system glycosyltransferase [Steroidobacteraceae bacterium]
MRILHVLDHSIPLHSGYTFRTLSILNEQRKRGWQTEHLTSSKHYGARAEVEEVDGMRFHRTLAPSSMWRRAPVLDQLAVIVDTRRRLEQVIAQTRPDIVHAHSPSLNGVAALDVAQRLQLPVVYEVRAFWEDAAVDHGSTNEGSARYRLSKALETWVLRRANAVTTICEGLRSDIVSRGIPAERITVIPNGVNTESFPVIGVGDAELKSRLGLNGAFVLGFLGSFYGYEGLDVLVQALPKILAFEPSARILLVGGGREEQRLAELAQRLGVADKVVSVGRVPHQEVARYYGIVDLLVFPRKSMRLTETVTPLKPLEAMSQGRLLMASNVGGHRELIRDGETGFLFPSDNPDALAESVRAVLAARPRWDAVRAAGRKFVEQERSWDKIVARYAPLYESLLQAKARAA